MKRNLISIAILLSVAGVVSLVVFNPASRADDAGHTTTLSIGSFRYIQGSAASVIAEIVSTDSSDASVSVTIYRTPSGGAEVEMYGGECDWSGSEARAKVAVPLIKFSSGDSVRANYQGLDSSGLVQWNFNRTLSVP